MEKKKPELPQTTTYPAEDAPKSVMIDGHEYNINSSNEGLLKDLEGGKKKNDKGVWEAQVFKYLPMAAVYKLMDGLYESYDIESLDATWTGESYTVSKYDYASKKEVADEVRAYRKTIRITTFNEAGIRRTVVGYAEGVAGVGILSKDNARNGFMRKLAARARKEALANLGQVFRVEEGYLEEEVEAHGLKEEAKQTDKVADKQAGTAVQDSVQKVKETLFVKYIDDLTAIAGDIREIKSKDVLLAAMKQVKKDNKIEKDTMEHNILTAVYDKCLSEINAK